MKEMRKAERIRSISLIFLITVFSGFLGYKFGAASLQSIKTVVEPGSMVTEASYVIFTDGTNYYARNGLTGEIEFQSTNASYVIQSVLDTLTTGGTILLKGRIFLENGITLKYDGQYLVGLGAGHDGQPTKLIYTGSGSAIRVKKTSGALFGFGIKNLFIDLGSSNDAVGIEVYDAHWGEIKNVYVYYGTIGIKLDGAWETVVDRCVVRGQSSVGILLDGHSGAGANQITIQNCYLDGAPVSIEISDYTNNPIGITIRRNNFGMSSNAVGIKVDYKARNLVIENNYFEEPLGITQCKLIQILGSSNKIPESIKIEKNTFVTANTAIDLNYAKGVFVERNWIYGYGSSPKFVVMTGNTQKVYIIRNMRVGTIATDSLTNEAIVRDDIR